MNGEHEPTARTASGEPHRDARVPGRWLLLARAGCLAVAGLALALFIACLPYYLVGIETVCQTTACDSDTGLKASQNLRALGFSHDFLFWFSLVYNLLFLFVSLVVGLVIFWRKPNDRAALVAAFASLIFPINLIIVPSLLPAFLRLSAQAMSVLSFDSFVLLFYVFPDGRFVPRWTRWLWAGVLIASLVHYLFPSAPFTSLLWQVDVSVALLSVVVLQIYRYRRVSTPVQRQQTKWVVLGVSLSVVGGVISTELIQSFPAPFTSFPQFYLLSFVLTPCLLLTPLAFGVAILRSHLWDIDSIINKALVYGLLTGLLGALYVGLILGLESLAGAMTGTTGQQPVALVMSTLAIAALFQPVRKRIQHVIDRRFYRKKYDAEKTLAAFSATLRQEVDLDQLRAQVLAVVNETMQPASLTLWLRPVKQQHTWGGTRGASLSRREVWPGADHSDLR